MTAFTMITNATVVGSAFSATNQPRGVYQAITPFLGIDQGKVGAAQGLTIVITGTGAVNASVQLMGSNDGLNWGNIGAAVAVTSATAPNVSATVVQTPFQYIAAYVTVIVGTSASVTAQLTC